MPAEPERHVEKMLRSYARRRREEAAQVPELHPATRQMLRDTAARTWRDGAAPAGAEGGWSARLWLRLGLVGATCVVVGAAVFFLWPGKDKLDLAKNENERPRAGAVRPESAGVDRLAKADASTPVPPPVPATKPAESREMEARPAARDHAARREDDAKALAALTGTFKDAVKPPATAAPDSGSTAGRTKADWRDQLRSSPPTERKLLFSFDKLAGGVAERKVEFITQPEPLYGIYTELPSSSFPMAEGSQASKAVEQMTRQLVEAARLQRAGGQAAPGQSQTAPQAAALARQQEAPPAQQQSQRARFRQAVASVAEAQVMSSFVIEQTGRQIRVIEDDGSVYEGQLTGTQTPGPASATGLPALSAAEPVPFVAMGFNRTLGQAVVFRGSFIPVSSSGLASEARGAKKEKTTTTGAAAAMASTKPEGAAPPNGGIRGKATVGGAVEVVIRAGLEKP